MTDTEQILVIDDDPIIVRLIQLLLEDAGYRCTTAESAAEARRLAAADAFALALCDMTMPNESGLELAQHLCACHPELAVVMVTAVDDPDIAKMALDCGAYGYVVKPFTSSVLYIAVVNALHQLGPSGFYGHCSGSRVAIHFCSHSCPTTKYAPQ